MLWPNNAWCFGLVISDGWGGWTRKQPYLLRNHHPIEWAKNRSTSTASFESDAMWGLWIRNSMSQKSGFCDSDIFWLQLLDFMAFHPPGFWWISWWWPMGIPNLGSCVLRASNGGNGVGESSRTLLSPLFMQKSWAHEGQRNTPLPQSS